MHVGAFQVGKIIIVGGEQIHPRRAGDSVKFTKSQSQKTADAIPKS